MLPALRRAVCLILVAAVSGAVTGSPAARADEGCIADWSQAAPIVKAEGLASVERVTELARAAVKGEIVKVTLCKQADRWVYLLVVREPAGRHKSLTVDAKAPFGR